MFCSHKMLADFNFLLRHIQLISGILWYDISMYMYIYECVFVYDRNEQFVKFKPEFV